LTNLARTFTTRRHHLGRRLENGESYAAVAQAVGCSENTLRKYLPEFKRPLRSYPTEAVRLAHGRVRWDLRLTDRHMPRVLVECQCGYRRHILAHNVLRRDRTFTGACLRCVRSLEPRPRLDRQAEPQPAMVEQPHNVHVITGFGSVWHRPLISVYHPPCTPLPANGASIDCRRA